MNAPNSHGRPFVDYRPDIGNHLFPSHITGLGIGRWRLRRLLAKLEQSGVITTPIECDIRISRSRGKKVLHQQQHVVDQSSSTSDPMDECGE